MLSKLSDVACYPLSISTILIIANSMPILLTSEICSLKKKMPISVTMTKFKMVKIKIAFESVSYFKEYAQKNALITYTANPTHSKSGLCSIVHFLKKTSPAISRLAPQRVNIQNNIFVDIYA